MATRYLARSLFASKQSLASAFSHSYAAAAAAVPTSSFVFRLRPLVAAAASASSFRRLIPAISSRAFATRPTTSSLNDPNPNWSNRPPKETILLDGCDFEHWLVVVEKPEGEPTRDEIIDSYIKTLAKVVGSEDEARMKIYSVSTRHYFAFGALVSEELSLKLKELPGVRWVLPDSYLDVKNKDYGGEPFINGQAVPYDPKYHEEWVRNNARANERNRRNDRPRNFDRSRNFERRREMQGQNSVPNPGGPGGNYGGQPHMGPPQANAPNAGPGQPNYGNNPGNYQANNPRGPANQTPNYQYGPGPNSGAAPYQPGPNSAAAPYQPGPNSVAAPYQPGPNSAVAPYQPGPTSGAAPYQPGPTSGAAPYQPGPTSGAALYQPGPTSGGAPYRPSPGPNQGGYPTGPGQGQGQGQYQNAYGSMGSGGAYQTQNNPVRDTPPPPNRGYGPAQNAGNFDANKNNFAPNVGPDLGQYQNAYNPQPSQNVPGRDIPPPSNY